MVSKNILVFPCGSEIAFEVYRCLNQQKDINLIGVSSIDDTGKFIYDNYVGNVPHVTSPKFISVLNKIILKNNIDFIYPATDLVLYLLKKEQNNIKCKILGSDFNTVKIFSQKSLTYQYFQDKIIVPKIYSSEEKIIFPVFSKPDIGSSSRNTLKIDDSLDLEYARKKFPDNLILEYLPGKEYTVDCFSDNSNRLLFVSARERVRIINGISVGTKLVSDDAIDKIANIINDNIKISGPWFFQLKKNHRDEYSLLEIADRFGGSSIINRILGVNFSYLNILKEYESIEIIKNNFDLEIARNLSTRMISNLEYKNVYIDLDDTLIIKNQVNLDAITFLYKCKNNNINIFLLTRHEYDIEQTLKKYNIPVGIFSNICYVSRGQNKSDFIKNLDSIFIDDSFKERKNVHDQLKIPVFSIENISML